MESNDARIARLEEKIESNKESIEALWGAHKKCVTLDRFRVVELIAMGLAALVMVPVISLIISKALAQ